MNRGHSALPPEIQNVFRLMIQTFFEFGTIGKHHEREIVASRVPISLGGLGA